MTDARFRAADGVEIAYTLAERGRERLIVVVPGILTDRHCAEHRLLADRLSDHGDVLTMDVRGHGDSGGAFSFGVREPEDVAALAASVKPRYREVAVVGFSFGGFHTLVAAASHPGLFARVAAVAAPAHLGVMGTLPSPRGLWRSLPLMARRSRRRTRLGVPRAIPVMPLAVVDRIAPTPLLLVHGTSDWVVPASHAQRLHARAGTASRLVLIEGGLHAEYLLADDPEPLLAALEGFLG